MTAALIAQPRYHHFNPLRNKTTGQFYKWNINLIKALGGTALAALKMYMIIVVMTLAAMAMAKGVFCRSITAGYGVDYPLFGKNLQGTVNGYPVEMFQFLFNIGMLERPTLFFHKKVENLPATVRNTHVDAAE